MGQRLLEGEEGRLQRALQGGQRELLLAEPGPMALGPVLPREIAAAVTIEELDDAMPPPEHVPADRLPAPQRSEEHTSELQSLMRISYAVFCLKKKKQ